MKINEGSKKFFSLENFDKSFLLQKFYEKTVKELIFSLLHTRSHDVGQIWIQILYEYLYKPLNEQIANKMKTIANSTRIYKFKCFASVAIQPRRWISILNGIYGSLYVVSLLFMQIPHWQRTLQMVDDEESLKKEFINFRDSSVRLLDKDQGPNLGRSTKFTDAFYCKGILLQTFVISIASI